MKRILAILLPICIGLGATAFVLAQQPSADEMKMTVWKAPTCSCCQVWIDYMNKHGFESTSYDVENVVPQKVKLGLEDPKQYSCHTTKIGDYVVEGHVPVADVKKMLKDKPDIIGLTAPGMPQMSPGMMSETPKGYDVMAIQRDGSMEVYSSY